MMSFAVTTLFFALATIAWARPDDTYTDQYDNMDVDEILQSDRLLNNYFTCLKSGKKCTPDGQKLREIFPEALKTNCQKCNDRQKEITMKVLHFLVENKPQMFKDLEDQYDPDHSYRTAHSDELKAKGIVLPD